MRGLALFDIDGTLITGTLGQPSAYAEAVRLVYDIRVDPLLFNMPGHTDLDILFRVLGQSGLTEDAIRAALTKCTRVMGDLYDRVAATDKLAVLDGVCPLLENLLDRRIAMGLVTGNLKQVAYAKLRRFGLDRYFQVGGFGDGSRDRSELVVTAIEGARHTLDDHSRQHIFYLGDTPLDAHAGKQARVRTIGVATGVYSIDQLLSAGVDLAVASLRDTRILDMILGVLVGSPEK